MVKLSSDDLNRLAQIVREVTGNQVQEKNFSMLESRIRSHIIQLGLNTMSEYWDHFKQNEQLERELIQSLMTTHYTFFFREYVHFEILDKWLTAEHARLEERYKKTQQPVKIWSAACSRGQEVYSLAMFLEFALFKKYNIPFEILGTDIDNESVTFAKNGVYPIKEVNTIPQNYLNGYWKRGTGQIKDFAAVHPSLKSKTKFQPLNLLELDKWNSPEKFDVIFCRNVFIYFSEENVKKIALGLGKHLDPMGLFVSGVSEPLRFKEWEMTVVGPSSYRRVSPATVRPAPASAPTATVAPTPKTSQPVETAPAPSGTATKYRVLCVDDSVTIQLLIKKIFSQDSNCEKVEVANNGKEARQKLDAGKFDLVTLDIHMPEVNGLEFLEKLYNRKSDPPVLMISSVNRTDLELATKSLALGAFDYIEKPAMNNLQKSTDEILTKARMALRSRGEPAKAEVSSFDTSISQKIVVPDASQCLRVVVSSPDSTKLLEQVVRAQKAEYRSPALIIVWPTTEMTSIEGDILRWTTNQLVRVRDSKQHLKPNSIFLADVDMAQKLLATSRHKTVSMQILTHRVPNLEGIKRATSLQVLLDESLSEYAKAIEQEVALRVSDITPATSFASLSVEFFANLRKNAA